MPNEETMTITETAPDGTETTIEITSTKPDAADTDGDKSIIEEVYEAIFDTDSDNDSVETDTDTEADTLDTEGDPAMYELTPTDEEISTNSTEFTIGRDSFPSIDLPPGTLDTPLPDVPDTSYSSVSPDYAATNETDTETVDPEAANEQAHADAARDAQAAADEFVAQGDYKAAAEARETAENEAWEAGDQSVLDGSDSSDLSYAASKQDDADYYRDQQAYHAGQGDYEAAKEDAQNVAYATGDADFQASGSDHTEQADKDVANLDWAVWDQKNAEGSAQNAEYYAAQGNAEAAERNADQAAEYQATADEYGAHADPGSDLYQVDASSEVASGGSYDSTYDATAVDTGFDAGYDAGAASTYDTTTDDV